MKNARKKPGIKKSGLDTIPLFLQVDMLKLIIIMMQAQNWKFFYLLTKIFSAWFQIENWNASAWLRTLSARLGSIWEIPAQTHHYNICPLPKVIYTKYSKHWLYTVAHTIECVCSKINNSWFNPWFSFYFSSLYPAPHIEWYMCSLFKFHTWILKQF